MDAAVSAIRRYLDEDTTAVRLENGEFLKSARISTKTRIALIAMKRDSRIIELLPKVFPLIELHRGDVMRLSEGKESIKLLVDEKNAEKVASIFPEDRIVGVTRDLSEISIHLGVAARDVATTLSTVMTELATNDIKIVETIGCLPEFMIFVDTKDVLKAHEIMIGLCGQ